MIKYLLIFLMLVSTSAFSELMRFKWIDAEGQVHYSDTPPPPDSNTKILRATTKTTDTNKEVVPTTPSAPAAAKTIAEREAELKKEQQAKKESAEKAAKKQADAEAKKTYCASLQQNLKALEEGLRMVEIDANGNRSFLEDEQRQQRITKAKMDISTSCK